MGRLATGQRRRGRDASVDHAERLERRAQAVGAVDAYRVDPLPPGAGGACVVVARRPDRGVVAADELVLEVQDAQRAVEVERSGPVRRRPADVAAANHREPARPDDAGVAGERAKLRVVAGAGQELATASGEAHALDAGAGTVRTGVAGALADAEHTDLLRVVSGIVA